MNSSDKTPLVLRDVGEFPLIKRLLEQCRSELPAEVVGAGDDCAVLPADDGSQWTVVTVDTMVEGRHFRRDYSSAGDIGWKLLHSTLSDIAAMGSRPSFGVVSLGAPAELELSWLEELYRVLGEAARGAGLMIVGGDTVSSPVITLSLTAVGVSSNRPILRSTAGVGDDIWVSGEIGLSSCGLALLEGKVEASVFEDSGARVLEAHRRPTARLELGRALAEQSLATAMIDISDGLVQDLRHILRSSNASAQLDFASLPIAAEVELCGLHAASAVSGGEDYQLLFTAAPEHSERLTELSSQTAEAAGLRRIGRIVEPADEEAGISIAVENETIPIGEFLAQAGQGRGGFGHF